MSIGYLRGAGRRGPAPAVVRPVPSSTTGMTPEQIVSRERARLAGMLETGVFPPTGYDDSNDWLCDLYPDFSWNAALQRELRACIADPEWLKLAEQLKTTFGFCILTEFTEALAEAVKEDKGVVA